MSDEADVRWLNEQEREAWVNLAIMLLRVPAALDRQLRADSGIRQFEYQVMVILSESPDRTLRMSQLAELTEGSLPRLSQVAGRLEKSGWLERRPDPDDGRSTLATLTDAGFEVLAAAAPGHVTEVRKLIFDPLTTEQVGHLHDITRRILDASGDPGYPPPPDCA